MIAGKDFFGLEDCVGNDKGEIRTAFHDSNSSQKKFRIKTKTKNIVKKRKKGISPFLSHSIIVAFSAFLILVVISTMNTITDEYRAYFSDNEINQFCFIIRTGIEKIYATHTYNPQTNTTYGEITIDLPEKLTDMNYRARFVENNITITAINTQKNATCPTGFDINFTGSTTGGLTKLEYKYYANGTRIISMSKV